MRVWPIVLAGAAFSGLLLAGGGASAMPRVSPQERPRGSDLRPEQQDQLWYLSKQVEALGVLPGFAEFTQASAWIESRFNPDAQAGPGQNAARGILQLRPRSAFNWRNDLEHLQSQPQLLFDMRWNVAMAADYCRRLIQYNTDPGQEVTFWDLRRGWKLPKYTRFPYRATMLANLQQFLGGIRAVGGDEKLVDRRAVLGNWPGTQEVMEALGL